MYWLFIDGVLDGVTACAGTAIATTGAAFKIGNYSTAYHTGQLCDARVYSTALTASQIIGWHYGTYEGSPIKSVPFSEGGLATSVHEIVGKSALQLAAFLQVRFGELNRRICVQHWPVAFGSGESI